MIARYASRARAGVTFLANFGCAKAAIYFAPLAIAATSPADVYGGIELALSLGLLLTAIPLGATLAGLTQAHLVHGEPDIGDQVALLSLLSCLAALAGAGVAMLAGAGAVVVLVVASLAGAALQNALAAAFRAFAWRNLTAWSDGLAMLIPAAIVFASFALAGRVTLGTVTMGYLVTGVFATAVAGVAFVRLRRPLLRERLARATAIGLPMLANGVFAIWLGVGGRMVVGLLAARELAAYSVAFRIAGLTLGIHQLATTAFFARLYKARTRDADRLIAPFFAAVGGLAMLIGLAGRPLAAAIDFAALDAAGEAKFVVLLPIVGVQVFFWIGYAMLQVRINRSRLAGRSLLPTAVLTMGGIALTFAIGAATDGNVLVLCWLIAAHSAGYFALSVFILRRGRLPHRRIAWVGAVGGAALTLLAAATEAFA